MKIKWNTVYVNDQEQALRFYTGVLGFQKKADFSQGQYRWLTVVSPEEPEATYCEPSEPAKAEHLSMPMVAMVAIDLLDMWSLTLAPSQHHSPAGQERGRTLPLSPVEH